MHAIIREDPPDLLQTVKGLPPALDRIVVHCLEKSPDERFQSARDVAFDLESLSTLSGNRRSGEIPAVRGRDRARLVTFGALVGAGALAGGLATWAFVKTPRIEPPVYRRLTFDRGEIGQARFAPDGQTIVYSASWRGQPSEVFTTRIDSRESRALGFERSTLQACRRPASWPSVWTPTTPAARRATEPPSGGCRWRAARRAPASTT